MTAFDSYSESFNNHFPLQQNEIKCEQYLPMMDSVPECNQMPWNSNFYSNNDQDFKLDMLRSMSENGMQQTHPDIAPSLLSSLPSASSSTVGSPYSGHAQLASNPTLMNSTIQYGEIPTIYDNEFPHAYGTAHFDHEIFFQESKMTGISVGKCADLSTFAQRSSTMPTLDFLSPVNLVSSPTYIQDSDEPSSLSPRQALSGEDALKAAPPSTAVTCWPRKNAVFKSPTLPASAYSKASSVSSAQATRAVSAQQPSEIPQTERQFPYNPMSSVSPVMPFGNYSQSHLFSQSSGNFRPPYEFSYPGLISSTQDVYSNTYNGYSQTTHYSPAPSPAPSSHSYASFSQPITVNNYSPNHPSMRRQSITSLKSAGSPRTSYSADEDVREKGRCPIPECGKIFKDLKAHMISHATVRPEKCPIVSCEYHTKGFARKYDKNRHTLTHYRGTMICGFCPGWGTATETTFNRADVFKRHLTLKHGVEQTPPNSRKRSPSKSNAKLSGCRQDATGKCSTCGSTFSNAQEFYEHLDDCVLKVVQQEEPSEAVNAKHLLDLANDSDVQATFERNNIRPEGSLPSLEDDEDDDDEEEEEEDEEDEDEEIESSERSGKGVIRATKVASSRAIIGGNICKRTNKKGLTWSRGGGPIFGKSRKRRKFYPPSWGMATDKMNMKKRVLCIYDGQRRLLKDDMMMHNEFEVRMPLLEGNSYVTDLDIETMKRAEAFHNALPEEKGPWIPEQDYLQLFEQ